MSSIPTQIDHRHEDLRIRDGSLAERFWSKVVQHGDCWIWRGARIRTDAYARFSITADKSALAHRWAYEQLIGPIPNGLELDHLCYVNTCVNPYHLDPVPQFVNAQRAKFREYGSDAEKCRRGHPRTPENQIQLSRPRGRTPNCRVCHRELAQARKAGANR